MSLLAPAVSIVLGVGLLLLWRVVFGPQGSGAGLAGALSIQVPYFLQHGLAVAGSDLPGTALLLVGASQLYLGVLNLVPLPPLDGGRLLLAVAPRTPFWQKAEHYLVEGNLGVVAVLVLLLVPLGGVAAPLPALLDVVLQPAVDALLGG